MPWDPEVWDHIKNVGYKIKFKLELNQDFKVLKSVTQ